MRKLFKKHLALLLILALALTNMAGVALADEAAMDANVTEEAVEAMFETKSTETTETKSASETIEVTEAEAIVTASAIATVSDEEDEDDTSVIMASGSCGDDLTWKLDSDGVLTISGTGPMEASGSGDYTFYEWYSYYQDITSVVINDGVTNIGEQAFYLVSSGIGLTSVTIPDSVTSIGSFAFTSSGLTSVTIPSSVNSIGSLAFDHCTSLASVTIENGVTTIGDCAFTGCTSLTSITIPASVTFIGGGVFGGAGLTCITFEGDAPTFGAVTMTGSEEYGDVFENVTATAYYPAENETWTEDVMQDYGGTITWVSYEVETEIEDLTEGFTLTSDGVVITETTTDYYFSDWQSTIFYMELEAGETCTLALSDVSNITAFEWSGEGIVTVDGTTITANTSGDTCVQLSGTDSGGNGVQTFVYISVMDASSSSVAAGDINMDGDVSGKDLIYLRQYLAGNSVTVNLTAADVNGDDEINGKDLIFLRKLLAN